VEDVGIFTAILSILLQKFYGTLVHTFCGHLVHFSCFGMLYLVKSGNPGKKMQFALLGQSTRDWPFRDRVFFHRAKVSAVRSENCNSVKLLFQFGDLLSTSKLPIVKMSKYKWKTSLINLP
jgi:hypothetical protein